MNDTPPETTTPTAPASRSLIEDKELARMAPEQLVSGFTKTPVLLFVVAAFIMHVLVIGGSSAPYIYYNFINPEAGVLREERLEAERKAALDAELKAKAGKSVSDTSAEGEGDTASVDGDGGEGDGDTAADGDGDDGKSPVERRIEETAEPDEIPSLDSLLQPTD